MKSRIFAIALYSFAALGFGLIGGAIGHSRAKTVIKDGPRCVCPACPCDSGKDCICSKCCCDSRQCKCGKGK